MNILLAESKTMSSALSEISPQDYLLHQPQLEEMADNTMKFIASLNVQQISEILGVSGSMAKKLNELAYDFPLKSIGYEAIFGFTGEAYRSLNISSISSEAKERANQQLRIISSLYGLLRPDDIIKPYRLDFNKNCAPGHVNIIKYLKAKVTVAFVKYLKENNISEVVDLLPGEAAKCLDWKVIKAFSKVNKICFQVIGQTGKLKTPAAGRLKQLRGLMARTILENNISSFSDLTKFEHEDFIYSPKDSKPGLPVFITFEKNDTNSSFL